MMKRLLFALLGLSMIVMGNVVLAGSASAETDCQTYTNDVVRLDSGLHGDWATDTFRRGSAVCDNGDGTWTLTLTDNGTFTTMAGATSPGDQAVPLPEFTGRFLGGAVVQVTSELTMAELPTNITEPTAGWPSTSEWAGLLFGSEVTSTLSSWGWNYTTKCETAGWVNSLDGNVGDVTGKTCETESSPPLPETTTTTPPTSTSQPPTTIEETGAPSDLPSSSASSVIFYENCTEVEEADAAPLFAGSAGYRTDLDEDEDGIACETIRQVGQVGKAGSATGLAYTGSPGLAWWLISGFALLAVGSLLVVLQRWARGRKRSDSAL